MYRIGEYKEKDINVEYCEAVEKQLPDFENIVFKKIESVQVLNQNS